MDNLTLRYIKSQIILLGIATYFLLSVILKAFTPIDICIPCLWYTLFGVKCPGCGLTTALVELLKLNFRASIEANWFVVIVVPLCIYILRKDFARFKKLY